MRPVLALAILLLGLRAAAPEPKLQGSVLLADADPSLLLEATRSPGAADSEFILAVPAPESSDQGHDQGEEAAEPPQAVAPASAALESGDAVPHSLDDLCNALLVSAENNNLPVAFFANLIWQESRLRDDAVSPVGALGIAQLMPRVARAAGVDNPLDPREAIPASARLLHTLREHFGNLGFVAAAYNAGARRVGEWLDRGRTLPRQTRTYVERITGQSVDRWRQAPLDDSQLTFVRRLPCRELPAFADLEHAQQERAQAAPAKPEERQSAEAKTAEAQARTIALAPAAVKHRAADRGRLRASIAPVAIRVAARNPRGSRREARYQHPRHERHRSA